MAGRGPAHRGRKVDDRHRAIAACAGNARRSLSFARYLGLDGSTRRIELTSLSAYPFCYGDRGAVGRSRMPIARSRSQVVPSTGISSGNEASIVAKAQPGIRFNEHIEGDGPTVFAHACKMGLEGIVSKRK